MPKQNWNSSLQKQLDVLNFIKDQHGKRVGQVKVIEHENYLEVVLYIGAQWRRFFFGYPK